MKTVMRKAMVAAAALCLSTGAVGAEVVKVGVIGPFSGPFAGAFGTPFRQGVETYVAMHGNKVGDAEVQFIYRDIAGPDPQKARSLAQELVVKDKVQYLAGVVFTPNAMAIAPLSQSAKVPMVIFNASTSVVVSKSDYFVRTSNTLPQVTVPVAKYALDQGIKSAITIVSDYGPGIDAEKAFSKTFEQGGGKIVDSIRMPLSTTDFGPFLQKIRAAEPESLFAFLPFGPPTYGFVKAYNDNALEQAGIKFLGTAETQESDLQALGDGAVGLETAYFYSGAHDSPENKAFVDALKKLDPNAIANPATVSAFDGAHVIYKMVEATAGKADGPKAVDAIKGMSWESPRGPVTIDAGTRDIVQNVYMRRVEKDADGKLVNREFKIYEAQPDYGLTLGE